MTHQEQIVVVVDDDDSVRDSLRMLFEAIGMPCRVFESGSDLLDDLTNIAHGCILLDISMPGISGLEMQQELKARGSRLPIIFFTAHADVTVAVKAMHRGAFDFIQKPVGEEELLQLVQQALAHEAILSRQAEDRAARHERLKSLTDRERQVYERVAMGQANKVIATELGIVEGTVEVHRSRVMKKLGARTLAELVRISIEAEAPTTLSNEFASPPHPKV